MPEIGDAIRFAFWVLIIGSLVVGGCCGACGYACASRYAIHVGLERK